MRWGLLLLSRRVLRQPYPFREMSTSARKKILYAFFFSAVLKKIKKNVLVIIEQLNPLANEQDAKFNIATGNTSFKDFILAYPSGNNTTHSHTLIFDCLTCPFFFQGRILVCVLCIETPLSSSILT